MENQRDVVKTRQTKTKLRTWCLAAFLFVVFWIGLTSNVHANGNFGKIRQAIFGPCFLAGMPTVMSAAISAPNLINIIGGSVALGRGRPNRGWGAAGVVTGTIAGIISIGVTATDNYGCVGAGGAVLNASSVVVNIVTLFIGIANLAVAQNYKPSAPQFEPDPKDYGKASALQAPFGRVMGRFQ